MASQPAVIQRMDSPSTVSQPMGKTSMGSRFVALLPEVTGQETHLVVATLPKWGGEGGFDVYGRLKIA